MIVMPRKSKEKLAYFDVLLRRGDIGDNEHLNLLVDLYKLRLDHVGKRRVDLQWSNVDVDGLLFHDFTCYDEMGQVQQIDTIFVCKHFVLVLDVINVAGRIDYNNYRRKFIRTREDGSREIMFNVVSQVKKNRELLEQQASCWPEDVPIEAAVVIGNPETVIGKVPNLVPIFNMKDLQQTLSELVTKHEQVSINPTVVRNELEELYKPLQSETNNVYIPVRKGVLCNKCSDVMIHRSRAFVCMNCGWRDKDGEALRKALHDYRVLYGPQISNKKFRTFFGVSHIQTANRMLNRLCSNTIGVNKGRTYIIPDSQL